jgi:hypothetical protein
VPDTTVTFSLRVPVAAPGEPESAELTRILERWSGTPGVTGLDTRWLALPRRSSEAGAPLHAQVEISVRIAGSNAAALRKLYTRLSREVSTPPIHLGSRSCTLSDMFESKV